MSNAMDFDAPIFVAGHRGLAGSAIVRRLQALGYKNLLLRTRQELDLLDSKAVHEYIQKTGPEYVFLAAAKVGGILANHDFPADFISQNLSIQNNIIEESYRSGVKRLLFLGSSCIYPKLAPQPLREEYLLTGPLEPTNRPYSIAKIAGIEMCHSFNRQHGTHYLAAMPTNLYGLGDSYDLRTSHVFAALIRKLHEAIERGDSQLSVWGTGNPLREFLCSDDMADACVYLMNMSQVDFARLTTNEGEPPMINIGFGSDMTIRELAERMADELGFQGRIIFDTTMPDGTPRKLLDSTRLFSLGWRPKIQLQEGIRLAYDDYVRRELSDSAEKNQ
jgi:GDP-L-fucose synthase